MQADLAQPAYLKFYLKLIICSKTLPAKNRQGSQRLVHETVYADTWWITGFIIDGREPG
jgi:hypothetical protein